MKYYPNITLEQLEATLPYNRKQLYLAIEPYKDGYLVFFCLKAWTQYQAQTTQGE